MWECSKCETKNHSDHEHCIVCGNTRCTDDAVEPLMFIEKLENSAILLEEFGVLPDLINYHIDSAILLQILLEVKFNMETIIKTYQIVNTVDDTYYTDGCDYIWQYIDSDGTRKWLLEREFRKNISYICIYDECKRLNEIDMHFNADLDNDSNESRFLSYELQLMISNDWISSSSFLITRTIPCKECKRANSAKRDMRLQTKLTFNEYGNIIDTAQIFLNGESAVEYHFNNQGIFSTGLLIYTYACKANDDKKILRFDMNLKELN